VTDSSVSKPPAWFAYVGAFTSKERGGNGDGLNVYRLGANPGDWTHIQLVEAVNPGFLALDRKRRFLYAAHGDADFASAFGIDQQTGKLSLLNQQPTGGVNGVHLALDSGNRYVVVANFTSGHVTVLPIREDGSLGPYSDLIAVEGQPGPRKVQQHGEPHQVVFDPSGRFIAVPDRGFDKVHIYTLDAGRGKLLVHDSVTSRPGAGPRHLDWHPSKPYAYILDELNSTITSCRWDSARGVLAALEVLSTIPATFLGFNSCAEVWVDPEGKFVYGSNRGHNSVVIFAINQTTGTLTPVAWEPTQGSWPRFCRFDPSGEYFYAANQRTDNIVIFYVNQLDGTLSPTGKSVKVGSPTCIVFL
jgi:6-phosphogluconolactonase (cycloisomerase 2 family)